MIRVLFFLFTLFLFPAQTRAEHRPNLLVIIIDDLNDWVGFLGGHPQVKTPHIDSLAERGMSFRNAHVQATYCGPSRISFLSGQHPATTGCYGMDVYSEVEKLRDHHPFPLHLRIKGYHTYGGGKIFHQGTGKHWVSKCWRTLLPSGKNPGPKEPIHWDKRIWDWGPVSVKDTDMGDFKLARAAANVLREKHEGEFLITAGIRRPHVPLHVPQKYFDLYPLDEIQLPAIQPGDLSDVPHPEIGTENYAAPAHSVVLERKLWKSLVQAYLASISFVDACVGEMMQALNDGPNSDTTFVILFSDHGFHLGEKHHWAKRTLWEETTRVPLLISGPGIAKAQECQKPVGMIDLYPTICDLAGIEHHKNLEGQTLVPLFKNPDADWETPAITEFNPGQISVRSEHWRYIRYPDETEELYDHRQDPNEWENLARIEMNREVIENHAKWIPVRKLVDN